VDDNEDFVEHVGELLTEEGYELRTAHTGAAGIAEAQTFRPHVIILDIGLPDIDGCEVAHRLSEEPALQHTHFIALTGYERYAPGRLPLAKSFQHILVKPVKIAELYDLLASLTSPSA
jgi:CheY-like chemotaxis protein